MDITTAFDYYIDMFAQGFKTCYRLLDRIQFHDISLLDLTLWVLCLGIILPIVLTLLRSGRGSAERYYNQRSRESRKKGD